MTTVSPQPARREPLKGVTEHRPDHHGTCQDCCQNLYPLRFGVWRIWISLESGQVCTVREAVALAMASHAEEIHAEHHPGTFVPSLDSCPVHTRSEYEEMVKTLAKLPRSRL